MWGFIEFHSGGCGHCHGAHKGRYPERVSPAATPTFYFLCFPAIHDSPCLTSNTCMYMPNRGIGIYRVKNQHMAALLAMSGKDKIQFCPQPSEEDRKYDTCSHVEIVDGLPPPIVWDMRKTVVEARAMGEAQAAEVARQLQLDVQLPAVASGGRVSDADHERFLHDFTGCKNAELVKNCWAEFSDKDGMPDVDKRDEAVKRIQILMLEELSAPLIAEARNAQALENKPRRKRLRSSDPPGGGAVQGVEGEGGGGEGGGMVDGPPKRTRKNRGGGK